MQLILVVLVFSSIFVCGFCVQCPTYTEEDADSVFADIANNPETAPAWDFIAKRTQKIKSQADRKAILKNRIKHIKKHNKETKNITFCQAPTTIMSTLDSGEQSLYLGLLVPQALLHNFVESQPSNSTLEPSVANGAPAVTIVDNRNLTGPVENQGGCGSCWAFAAAHSLQGAWARRSGKVTDLSEQQFVDCVYPYDGCQGGDYEDAWHYLVNDSIADKMQQEYPYLQKYSGSCNDSTKDLKTKELRQLYAPIGWGVDANWDSIEKRVALQPVAVAFRVINDFYEYASGIYSTTADCTGSANHALTLVGYGIQGGVPYWIAKNSWGSTWGEEGYVRILKGVNLCSIESLAMFPIV